MYYNLIRFSMCARLKWARHCNNVFDQIRQIGIAATVLFELF